MFITVITQFFKSIVNFFFDRDYLGLEITSKKFLVHDRDVEKNKTVLIVNSKTSIPFIKMYLGH